MKDKESIPSFEGVVSLVRAPKPEADLSDAQKNKGIHPQDIAVADDDGTVLEIQIITSKLHVPATLRGHKIRVECGNNEGQPCGLRASVYQGKCKAVISSGASITKLSSEPTETTKPKEDQVGPPKKQDPSKGQPAQGKFVLPSIRDYSHVLSSLFGEWTELLKVEGIEKKDQFDLALRAATTVFIQVAKDGLVAPSSKKDSQEEFAKPTIQKFATQVMDGSVSPTSKDGKKLTEVVGMGLFSWKELSDKVKSVYAAPVQKAYDDEMSKIKAMLMKRGDNADDCYKIVLMDFKTFKDKVTEDQIPY